MLCEPEATICREFLSRTPHRPVRCGLVLVHYAICMKRTTIMLTDDLDARLRLEARRRGVSVAQVARDAIERELPSQPGGRLSFFAIGEGSPPDASERVEEFVVKSVRRRRGGRSP